MEVLYSSHVDNVRKIDKDKEQNPRPIKMKFIQENGELSYVKLEPMAFENVVFENIKLKFQSYSMMREQRKPFHGIEPKEYIVHLKNQEKHTSSINPPSTQKLIEPK